MLSQLESEVAGVIRSVQVERALPVGDELDTLIGFVALMFTRVPWFRATVSDALAQIVKHVIDLETATPERWEAAVQDAQRQGFDPGLTREEMREVLDADEYDITASQNYSLGMMLRMMQGVYPVMRARNWSLLVARDPQDASFVTSDNPVNLVPGVEMPAFWSPGLATRGTELTFPLDGEVCLLGKFEDSPTQQQIDSHQVAQVNTRSAIGCTRFVYSGRDNFSWMERSGKIGNRDTLLEYARRMKQSEDE